MPGVSVHIVRDYLLRGLLRPVAYTTGGYGLFDDTALQRLRFVRAAFEAGIGLDALARLCRALDAADGDGASAQLAVLRQLVERRREALASLEMQLAAMPSRTGTARGESAMNSPEHLPSETHKPITGYVGRAGRAHLSLPFADSRHCASRHDGRRVHPGSTGVLQPSR